MNLTQEATPIQKINDPIIADYGVHLFIKRDDLIHPEISGNKWRKLKYNLLTAYEQKQHTLLTFGGAYSNHIFSVAAAGKQFGFKTIGIIRGEEHLPLNPTLTFAKACGMGLHYMDRTTYRQKHTASILEDLKSKLGDFYLIPEGGTNPLAVKGCTEIIDEIRGFDFDYLCSACGTGGTLTGLIAGLHNEKKILGFSALKGGTFLNDDVENLLKQYSPNQQYHNWKIQLDYHFGGFAKKKPQLMAFIEAFEKRNKIPLEFIYTGKMLYGIYDLIQKGFFKKGENILALHTGGLQGRQHTT